MYKFVLPLFLLNCAPFGRAYRVPVGALGVDVSELDFGGVALGTTGVGFLRFSNDGAATLDAEFVLEDPAGQFQVMRDSLSLGSNETAEIEVQFRPGLELEVSTALLYVTWEQGLQDLSVDLSGGTLLDADGDGGTDVRLGGDDCDDSDDQIYTGAQEVWYDGLDSDCDGWSDFDQDGDGYEREPEGRDCDDEDDERYPGQPDGSEADSRPGLDSDCDKLVDEDALELGDVLISEMMILPEGPNAAFVEIYNASGRVLYLDGWEFTLNGHSVALPKDWELDSGTSFLACDEPQAANGWSCDIAWSSEVELGQGSGAVRIGPPSLPLDSVLWDGKWPIYTGASVQLDINQFDESANDVSTSWCSSATAMANGEFGTPGSANDTCLVVSD
jgi:hypothetical protein